MKEEKHECVGTNSVLKPKTQMGYIMQRFCKVCNKLMDDNAPITTFEGLVRAWVHGKLGKKKKEGHYEVIGKKIVYKGSGRNADLGTDVLALRLKDGRVIGNASKLHRCGSYRRGDEAPAQRVMFDLNMALIPFNVFEEAKMNIQTAKVIEQGKEEDFILPKLEWNRQQGMLEPVNIYCSGWNIKKQKSDDKRDITKQEKEKSYVDERYPNGKIKRDTYGDPKQKKVMGWKYHYIDKTLLAKRHFVGAMVIEVGKKHFLFDIDRRELKYYRFNPFLAELPKKVKTITEAYEILKPKEVEEAEKSGLKVLRQGEWFFIPTKIKDAPKIPKISKKLQEKLDNKPNLDEYDLGYDNGVESGDDVVVLSKVRKDRHYKKIKKKYRASIINRVMDYNRAMKRYNGYVKQKEKFESTFMYYEYGGELKAGNNRPNNVEKLFIYKGINYAKGKVTHSGREHEPLHLENWHIAIPNTAAKSFTITGNID